MVMGNAVAMPERELLLRAADVLTRPDPKVPKVFSSDSRIDLYLLLYEGQSQSSVFVYDATFDLIPDKVLKLHSLFSGAPARLISRTFHYVSVDRLNDAFVKQLGSLKSNLNREYERHRPPIIEHCFLPQWIDYLKGFIRDDLKVSSER